MIRRIVGVCPNLHHFPVKIIRSDVVMTQGHTTTVRFDSQITDEQHQEAHVNLLRRMDGEEPPCPTCGEIVRFTLIEKVGT